jgi:hypothetical protein
MKGDTYASWATFRHRLKTLINSIPLKTNKAKTTKAPWLTYTALKLVKKKYRIYAKYKSKDHPAVKRINTLAAKAVKRAKIHFEEKLAQNIQQDKKSFYTMSEVRAKYGLRWKRLKTVMVIP